jgi:hypothetical protein
MTFAPDDVYECPSCKKLIRGQNLASGNTFGAVQYSDTYVFLPFMASYPNFTRCKGCGAYFKLKSLKSIGTFDVFLKPDKFSSVPIFITDYEVKKDFKHVKDVSQDVPPLPPHYEEWEAADVAAHLTIYELAEALEQGVFDNEKDLFALRRMLFFRFNDRVRKKEELFQHEGDELLWRTNLGAFLQLLTGSDYQSLLMRAEIHRNFGNFEDSIEVLKSIPSPKNPQAIEFLIDQCKQGNRMVVEIE